MRNCAVITCVEGGEREEVIYILFSRNHMVKIFFLYRENTIYCRFILVQYTVFLIFRILDQICKTLTY